MTYFGLENYEKSQEDFIKGQPYKINNQCFIDCEKKLQEILLTQNMKKQIEETVNEEVEEELISVNSFEMLNFSDDECESEVL